MENSFESILKRVRKIEGYINLDKRFSSVKVCFNPYSGKCGMVVAERYTGEWVAEPIKLTPYHPSVDRSYRPDTDYNNGAMAMAAAIEEAMTKILGHAYPVDKEQEVSNESSS